MTATKIYHELREIKNRLLAVEEHLRLNTPDSSIKAVQYTSQMCELFRIMRRKAPVIPIKTILAEAKKKNIPHKTTLHCLTIMFKEGEIFEPKKGFIQRI
ncbi:TPA: hypothetical protein HA241_04825 [Candidatus Woesearchaeota archaeon]|nr:hypothetical protein [Candidatus Woesearchaeota archaeon]